jgi:hypothetical protein
MAVFELAKTAHVSKVIGVIIFWHFTIQPGFGKRRDT